MLWNILQWPWPIPTTKNNLGSKFSRAAVRNVGGGCWERRRLGDRDSGPACAYLGYWNGSWEPQPLAGTRGWWWGGVGRRKFSSSWDWKDFLSRRPGIVSRVSFASLSSFNMLKFKIALTEEDFDSKNKELNWRWQTFLWEKTCQANKEMAVSK